VKVGGQPVDPARTYKVVTSDFLYTGGDDLGRVFAGTPIVAQGALLRDVFSARIGASAACLASDGPVIDPSAPRVRLGTCP